ncbi:Fe-S cluster assembly protein SufB [Candidatus Karelsulcia muelleri]|uniref:Fe-S cluster assembly protein SufB n=1 Tax=Candidatus Karelsulcia muelleri TaxID=336810 RepID=UPI00130EB89A|nr:Fe-S cluster assembly protein SufB [Candidatus Karelsulcia muelleri]WDI79615.1 Fe-S cluster assembly protein SufB [Candidatus Karelsulcia muelleri]WDR78937.1 Fe-S cluster assembly protein SufB [Candidatus Karelsulcia muelleri]
MKNKILLSNFRSGYKYGFHSKIESDNISKGLNKNTILEISKKNKEPKWLVNFRIRAFKLLKKMSIPKWGNVKYKKIDLQNFIYYSAPKNYKNLKIDPEIRKTLNKLKLPIDNKNNISKKIIEIIIDSVAVTTSFKKLLFEKGIIFCSISKAIIHYPKLVKKYLSKAIPINDNFFSTLNSSVFSDGSFCYVPKNIRCPIELSTYFRINESGTGQFERTLLIADKNSYVSYLEGCTAPQRKENQLHAAVVELIAMDGAEIKYSTVQNWFPGNKKGLGGIFNFVTKRGICEKKSKISWTQIENGSSITWKYPSCILKGKNSKGNFFSIAITKNFQQSDTGTKMIHIGENSKSIIISKAISTGNSKNSYRGLVNILKDAFNSRNYTQCDSLLFGHQCKTSSIPDIQVENSSSKVEHEAIISLIERSKIFYCNQRGILKEKALQLIVNGYSREIINKLPLEFALEARKLLDLTIENSIG